ncbi:MAG: hypothetical protein F4X34_07190, partial [Chloroflexi bacterium]|nr:hypothetical protein [Chloroflexota bacterium]
MEVYCGTDESGRLISRVRIPSSYGLPGLGTYSTEPPLTALSVSHGTLALTPNPDHGLYHYYTVSDVANTDTRITIDAIPKTGYAVEFYESSDLPPMGMIVINPGLGGLPTGLSDECDPSYGDHLGTLPDLTDADPNTPGFQMDLYDGDNHIFIRVYPTSVCKLGEGYHLTIIREEGPVSLVRPNRPSEGLSLKTIATPATQKA